MKDMAAVQLFSYLDVTKTDAALVGRRTLLLRIRFHVLQPFKLEDKLTPFVQSDGLVAQCAQIVSYLTEDIDWKGTPTHNYEK